jgi:hypothetical protein
LDIAKEIFANDFGRVHLDGFRDVSARSLHGDIVVVVKVDSRSLLDVTLEELTFEAFVRAHIAVVASFVALGAALAVGAAAAVVLDAAPAGTHVALVAAAASAVGTARAAIVSSSPASSIVSSSSLMWRGSAVAGSATGLISQVRRNCRWMGL